MEHIEANGLEFIPISSGSSWLGSDKGGWIYASQRPRYEVRLPSYYIMKKPLTRGQVARLLDEDESPDEPDEPMTGLTINEIHALREAIESNLEEESLDVRLPSKLCRTCVGYRNRDYNLQGSAPVCQLLTREKTAVTLICIVSANISLVF